MGLIIVIIDGGITVEKDADTVESYPSGSTSLTFNNGDITSKSEITSPFIIKGNDTVANQVTSIDDNRTGGAGSIAIPATVRLLYDLLNPFFFKVIAADSSTLKSVLAAGNISDGNDISLSPNDDILMAAELGFSTLRWTANMRIFADDEGEQILTLVGLDSGLESLLANGGTHIFRSSGASSPILQFATSGSFTGALKSEALTASRTWTLPNKTGVLATLTDASPDLGEFTVGGLPTASSNANKYALATDASGGRTVVRSNGSNWKVIVVEGATVTT